MSFVLHPPTAPDRQLLGGKAAALAALDGLPVPPWIALTPDAFRASVNGEPADGLAGATLSSEVSATLARALKDTFAPQDLLAVRSSAVDEDGASFSFAGQLESFLNVALADVPARVVDVWRSGFSTRLAAYRRQHGMTGLAQPPAVLIQKMIAPTAAGVAFSADPISGRRGICVVSAVRGLGDKLVSGEADADTFHVDRSGSVVFRQHSDSSAPVLLGEHDLCAIAALAREAERRFGVPQDIEWALQDGKAWLLQSRPITTLAGMPDPDGALSIWDNSNIAESYGGITTPLTFSFARRAYEEVYRQFCRLMRVPESTIADNATTFRCMIGLVRGRVFYNLGSWHRVLGMLPGYAINRPFMEQMMGVKESLPAEALPQVSPANLSAKIRDAWNLFRTACGLVRNHITLTAQIDAFYRRLNRALSAPAVPLEQMRPDELVAHYGDLERQLLTRWDAPLVNDFFAMIFYGVLRKMCQSNESPEGAAANDLIRHSGDIISAEPARRMKTLAALAAPHMALVTALQSGTAAEVNLAAADVPVFKEQLDDYLKKFGDRCLDELKLESSTLVDDPLPLFRSLGALASRPAGHTPASANEPAVSPAVSSSSPLFRWVLQHARARVRDRENLRFERTRLFGRVRRIFVELGKRFHASGLLAEPRDIFYLELNEIIGFVGGTGTTSDLAGLVKVRKAEFSSYHQLPPPSDRFQTRGMVCHGNSFQRPEGAQAETQPADADSRKGLPCCAGVVRGPVRVITDPRGAIINPGEILVAERTDPGWILLFPAASGVLVERGSLLSHAAIVSRELGLPGIVSISGLTSWLHTGEVVEMDGSTGVVSRVDSKRGNDPSA